MALEAMLSRFDNDEYLEGLKRLDLGQGLNFDEAVETIRVIRDIGHAYDQTPANEQSNALNSNATNQLNQLGGIADQIGAFQVGQENPVGARGNLLNSIEQIREWFVMNIRPQCVVSPAAAVQAAAQALEAAASAANTEAAVATVRSTLEADAVRASTTAAELETLLSRLRQEAGEVGAGQLSSYYKTQASGYKGHAGRWLAAAVTLTLGTIGAAFLLVLSVPVSRHSAYGTQWEELVRNLGVRLFVLGLLTYGVTFLFRTYRVNKHLQVANEEKRNALDTYGLFANAVATDQARDIITAALVRAVFTPTDTGYLGEVSGGEKDDLSFLVSLLSQRSG